MLEWMQDKTAPEKMVDLARVLEELLSPLGRPQALVQATKVREQAGQGLSEWSHGRFLTESANIDRLLERSELLSAFNAARQLLQRCLEEGEAAYSEADYDIAAAHVILGTTLRKRGYNEQALSLFTEAHHRFQSLANVGNTYAERMASSSITQIAICLGNLGRLDEASTAFEEAIKRFEKLGDKRSIAVSKGNLGNILFEQGYFQESLKTYTEARNIFDSMGEPKSVAIGWHQIARVHRRLRQFEKSEESLQRSLAIFVQQKDSAGEAASLVELGNLYREMGRPEDAVKCCRRAVDTFVKAQDQRSEGVARSNLAGLLIGLQRYDEARLEVLRAIECKKPYGHSADPWKTWKSLYDLEQSMGNTQAASEARQQAIQSYLAYRHERGQSSDHGAQLCAMAYQAISQGDTTELEQYLAQLSEADDSLRAKAFIPKLQAILQGDRDPALADDPNLEYDDAVELQLLLEALQSGNLPEA